MQNELYSLEAEQIILGSAIMNNAVLLRVSDFLEEKHFYFEENKIIFCRFIELSKESIADYVTLKDFFQNNEILKEVGGAKYLTKLIQVATGVIDMRDYGFLLVELWQKRELEKMLTKALSDISSKTFNNIAANLENDIAGLATKEPAKKTQHIAEIINQVDYEDSIDISSKFTPTGFNSLDDILNGGIHSKQLAIIGARPSVGKTSIAQNIILNASQQGKKCLFISLEVDKRNVYLKFLSNVAGIDGWKLQRHGWNFSKLEKEDIITAKEKIKKMEIYVDDSSSLRIGQIGQKIKSQIERNPVDLVVVDYVQIVRGDDVRGKNESSIIKETTTQLKAFAKQYDVGILALAQINRKAVEGANQEPTINDFKSSGGIEEDADIAIILHRDRSEDKKESYFSSSGKLIVAKNRHGRTGEIALNFDGNLGKFTEISF